LQQIQFLNYMALVKHNNNSISAVTSMESLSTGSMTFISEQTASSSASISFTSGIDSTYPIYKFEFINMHPASDDISFQFQGSTNSGSSYGVTITSTMFRATQGEDGSSTALSYLTGGDLAQSTSYQLLAGSIGSDNDQSVSGNLFIFNPSSTTFVKHFMGNMQSIAHSNRSNNQYLTGYFNSTSALDAFNFKFSSGNIGSGTIKLYGIKDS
jgi:hypothetical protein